MKPASIVVTLAVSTKVAGWSTSHSFGTSAKQFLVGCRSPAHLNVAMSSHAPWVGHECSRHRSFPQGGWGLAKPKARFENLVSEALKDGPSPMSESEDLVEDPRPYPKVGDIVRYDGKWEDDVTLGEIRQLQFVEQTGKWRAYVLPLKEIGEDQYARKKGRRSAAEDAEKLRPVRAFYVRSVDGFKVMTDSETGEPRYISDGYKLDDFQLPVPVIDPAKAAVDLKSYEDLKSRILWDAVNFGAVGSILTFLVAGTDLGLLFAFGSLAAVSYVILLEKNADDVASGNQGNLSKLRGDTRFLMPVLLILSVALKNYITHPETVQFLSLVPKNQFAAAMLGFVAPSRLPLLYREIKGSIKGEELLDMVPGSVGQGKKILEDLRGSDAKGFLESTSPSNNKKVIVVSGPKGLGKTTLVQKMLEEDSRLSAPLWCTSRPQKQGEIDGETFQFLEPIKFEEVQRVGGFLETFQDRNGESYGLRKSDILSVSKEGKACIIDADTSLAGKLMGVDDVTLVGVWVSLDNMPALEKRVRIVLAASGAQEGEEFETEVRGRIRQAISDIQFGVTSKIFEFTAINHDIEESLITLRKAVNYTLE
ncbi:unnamed protein product [Choristocarpus tenellus]